MTTALWLIVLAGALSIVYGIVTTRSLMAADAGSARMQEISAAVREGAKAYLNRQYTTIGLVGVVNYVIAFFLLANSQGALGIAAVVSSQYPAVTAILARVVLHERMTRAQLVGLGLAAVAAGCVAAGG